jgi:hypothetical protein
VKKCVVILISYKHRSIRKIAPYPFTAPNVSPLIKYFCTIIEKMRTGKIITTEAAVICPHSNPLSVRNPVIATGSVSVCILVRIIANKNSFHEKIIQKIDVAMIPGRDRGKTILKIAPKYEQPSIKAASSISVGIASKKFFKIKIESGKLNVKYAIIKPIRVFTKLILLKKINKGMIIAIPGITLKANRLTMRLFPPFLNLDILYAVNEPKIKQIIVTPTVTITLFVKLWRKGLIVKAET